MSARTIYLIEWLLMSLNIMFWVVMGNVLNLGVGIYLIGCLFELRGVMQNWGSK